MTREQINLIRESFQKVAAQADIAADVFYNRLFEIEPALQSMFPEDLQPQKQKLMKTLALAAASLDRFAELETALEALGRKHAGYGVREEFYPMVGGALLWTLNELLGAKNFTPETEAAWSEMFEKISATMIRAARQAAAEAVDVQLAAPTAKLPTYKVLQPLAV